MAEEELRQQLKQLQSDKDSLLKQLDNAKLQHGSGTKQDDPVSPQVNRVAVKLPPFWADKPAVWFAQAEAQFKIAGITSDDTRFNYIVGNLDQRLAGEIEDIMTKPPDQNKYEKIKEELIRRLSISEEQKVRQLISDEELGSRKPSQFLRHLRSLAGAALSDDNILRQLWLRRLPQQVQAILAAQADLSLDKISELADKIIELSPGLGNVHATSAATSAATSVLDKLLQRVDDLGKQVAALSSGPQRSHRSRSRSASADSKQSRATTPDTSAKNCWYHKRFGTKASKCISPCNWSSEN